MKVSFVKEGMANFFGRKEGQTLKEFADELKALTHQDKLDLIKLAADVGEVWTAPPER